jgi:hypothetical protein
VALRELPVQCDVLLGHAAAGVAAQRTLARPLRQPRYPLGLRAEPLERAGERGGVVDRNELRAPVPELAKGADVGEDERASLERGFQRRQPERLVARGGRRTPPSAPSTRPPRRAPRDRAPPGARARSARRAARRFRRERGSAGSRGGGARRRGRGRRRPCRGPRGGPR